MSDAFKHSVALVTGASSGIGRAIALALGAKGARVGVNCHNNRSAAAEVTNQIEKAGGQATVLQADVSVASEVDRMFAELATAFGNRLEMLVNCAGDWMDKTPIIECPEAHWDRMFAVNAKSVFLCCQQAARRMMPNQRGAIVNIGSVAGHTGGGGGTVPYAAAKAAVHTLTRGLAKELGPHGIRVNAVAPGMIETPMLTGRVPDDARARLQATTPLGRFGLPEEIAPLVLLLLDPSAASYITGQVIEIDGGLLMR
ncbi:MAG: 3-oxoacyl-ACP reductase FabG [Pirellulales bacterium]|nr:3-oxoacyl-ACP reductase FabG [Pirellulales bacterium]